MQKIQMIIKLIQPKMQLRPMDTQLKIRMSPSLALLTIANIIPQEHTVIIENENVEPIRYDSYADLVGISVTVDTMPRAIKISKQFRKRGIKVIAGGIHITSNPKESQKYFDSICIGMAENTWPQIIRDTQMNTLKTVYISKLPINSSDITSPKYDIIDYSKYLYTNVICTSRGCPFQCSFCYNSCKGFQKVYVNRPIKDVIHDIKTIGKKHIMFIDDNFIGNPKWTANFLQAIMPLKLKWNAAVSANIVEMPDLLDAMKASGCQSLFIGFESLNASSIDGVHKKQNHISKYEKLVNEIHRRGIMINASFVFGLDGDDTTTFQTTLDWIVKNKIETVTSHILTPYPGTTVYDEFLKNGRIVDFNLSHYNTSYVVFKPKNMTGEELYDGYIWIYKQIYSFKNIIKRLPKHQKMPYLAFNLFYRKFGRFSEKLCNLFSFYKIGRLGEWIAYKIK